ncbi:hypothetical protein [Aquirufa ecclesiirivi]|uniref:hypothetical protein n=1 Tax=Aquirufa ecclesiirivi TaxID=2715124 RepID=UPI003BB03203
MDPKYSLTTIDKFRSLFQSYRRSNFEFPKDFNPYFDELRGYLYYLDDVLENYFGQRIIDFDEIKSLVLMRERILRIYNPKVKLVAYHEPRENDTLYAFAMVYYLNDEGDEVFDEVDITELLPQNFYAVQLREKIKEKTFRFNVDLKVYNFLKSTIEIPADIDFESKRWSIHNYYDFEYRTNYHGVKLRNLIDKLNFNDLEQSHQELYKSLLIIKNLARRYYNKQDEFEILNLKNKP